VYEFASKELDVSHISIDFIKSTFKNMFDINEKFHNYLIFIFLNNNLINTIIM